MVFADDKQVADLHVRNLYGETPQLEMTVKPYFPRELTMHWLTINGDPYSTQTPGCFKLWTAMYGHRRMFDWYDVKDLRDAALVFRRDMFDDIADAVERDGAVLVTAPKLQ